MKRVSFLTILVLCLSVLVDASFALDKPLEKLALEPIENLGRVPPIHSPGGTDEIAWTMMTPCPENFNRGAIGHIGNYVYIFGNYCADDFAQAFNLATESWENSTPPPIDGCNWVGVVANGSMYVFPQAFFGSAVQKFTPTGGGPTGTWVQVCPYPLDLGLQTIAWDGGNYIYCAGGTGYPGTSTNAYCYDIAGDTFTPIAPLPEARKFVGGAFLDGKFYVAGGLDESSQSCDNLYEYDPATDIWTEKSPMPIAAGFAAWATTYNIAYLFIVGGGGGYSSWPAIDACQVYDPASDSWFLDTPRPLNIGTNEVTYVTGLNYLIDGGGYDGAQNYNVIWKGTNPPGGADPNAPAAPTDFSVTHNNAELIATLDWVNPSLQVNGDPLTELTGVILYRSMVLVDTLTDVQIGQPYTYDDSVPSVGMYQYRLAPYNSFGVGIEAFASGWIGLDTPGPPDDVTATPDPNFELVCTITWSEPTEGEHGGYWPPGSWDGQKIYRDEVEIADLPGTNTSYVDSTVPAPDLYAYGVSYYNSSGEGPIVNAPEVMVGPPLFAEIPFDWIEISTIGTNTGITGDDQNLGPFALGFSFPFYECTSFDSLRVCSNGFASFTSTSSAWTNQVIPYTSEPNNLIAPYWDDLSPNLGGNIWYYQDTVNNRFIVEWDQVPHYGTGGSYTFEIILYPDGTIDYMYMELTLGTANSATVGIENGTGTAGIQCTYNGSGPLEPTAEMGIRIYPVTPGVPEMALTLTPYGTPIQIPAGGGRFNFNIQVENLEPDPVTCDVWTEVILPSGNPVQILLRTGITFAGGAVIQRNLTQTVPAAAPAGDYTYHACVGSHPNTVYAEDSFPFEKLAAGEGVDPGSGWTLTGWDVEDGLALEIPTEYTLQPAYPNPFNPLTTISFALPVASHVRLTVFDLQGRVVSKLVDGLRGPGVHNVTWDAGDLASGLYFCRIEAGDYNAVRKMVLVK